jgi:ComEC/Rec2-related protein
MSTFLKYLLFSPEGHGFQRPIIGWSCAILLGALLGILYPSSFFYLLSATFSLLLAWIQTRRWCSFFLALTLFSFVAWYSSTQTLQRTQEESRIHTFKENDIPLPLSVTIGDDLKYVTPQQGRPYVIFSAKDVCFEDGTLWKTTTLRVRYYDEQENYPKRGERWHFNLRLYHYPHRDKITGVASKETSQHLSHEDTTNTIAYTLGTLRERFAEHLSYGLINPEESAPQDTTYTQRVKERKRLVAARDTKTPLTIHLTVDPESYTCVERKRGRPYFKFKALQATFEDGTPIQHTTLNIHFYNNKDILLENDTNFPRPNERWQLNLTFRKSKSSDPKSLTASTSPDGAQCIAFNTPPPPKQNALQQEKENLYDATTSLRSILLGAHYKLPHETRQTYADAGIIHIFAISGLHVGILAGLVIFILAWLKVRIYLRFFFLLPILVGYLLLIGAPPSATRACLMALLYCFAATQFRKNDPLSFLLITADVIILFNPFLIQNIGTILSFFAIGGIFLFYKPLSIFLAYYLVADPTPEAPAPAVYPYFRRFRYWFAQTLAVTVSAWLITLPLSLYFFRQVSLIGLLLNLFIPFLTLFIVWGGVMSACLDFFFPWASCILNKCCATLLLSIDTIATYATQLPYATFKTETSPHWLIVTIFEALIILLGLYLRVKARKHIEHQEFLKYINS